MKLKILSVLMLSMAFSFLTMCGRESANGEEKMGPIKKNVIDQLFWDNRVNSANVKVSVEEGVVTLRGTVATYTAKRAAELDAWSVPGVVDVRNLLKVEYPDEITVPDDQTLKSRVQSVLIWNSVIDSTDIRVEVIGGIVTLKGSVNAYWKKMQAEDLVSDVTGVISVTNQLAVVPTDKVTDEMIARDIMQSIARNINVYVEDVNVKVENGNVTLSGTVEDWQAKLAAYNAALYTAGVKEVNDNIQVQTPDLGE
jgi:osmotically-inducible protein OsmY